MSYRDRDDSGCISRVIAHALAGLVKAIFLLIIAKACYSAPETGLVVATAGFGDDGYRSGYWCQDQEGIYECTNDKRGDDPDLREHLPLEEQYEFIDAYARSGSPKFAVKDDRDGRYYEVEFSDGQTIVKGEIPRRMQGDLVAVAQRNDVYTYWWNDGLHRCDDEGTCEFIRTFPGYDFVSAKAFTDSGPYEICRQPSEGIGDCPDEQPTGLQNAVSRVIPIEKRDILLVVLGVVIILLPIENLIQSFTRRRKRS